MKGPAWTGLGESSEENSSMISSRSPADATLEESSPGSSKFACSVTDSAEAAINVALTGQFFCTKLFIWACPACVFEVVRGGFVPVAKFKTGDEGCFTSRDRKAECLEAKNFSGK